MKIDKSIETGDGRKVLSDRYSEIKKKAQETVAGLKKESGDDSVQVPLGRAVQDTLDSIKNDTQRSLRVAELKKLIQSGGPAAYFAQVSTDEIAPKVSQEIDLEILTSRSSSVGGDEE